MTFVQSKSDSKDYHIFVHETYGNDCVLIMGRNQNGNDYIISNVKTILKNLFGIETIHDDLIWMHGFGPSAHVILYRKSKTINLTPLELEMFVKSKFSAKSEKGQPLTCSLLKDVTKTDIKGSQQLHGFFIICVKYFKYLTHYNIY